MWRVFAVASVVFFVHGAVAQTSVPRPKFDAFEVASVRPIPQEERAGRYIKMEGTNRFVAKNFTLKLLIAAAYDMNSRTISGGPGWVETDRFDIAAVTPGEVRPTRVEQMTMLRALLSERFTLTFHRQQKEFSLYELTVAKGGPKMKTSVGAGGCGAGADRHRLSAEDSYAGAQCDHGRLRRGAAAGDSGPSGGE